MKRFAAVYGLLISTIITLPAMAQMPYDEFSGYQYLINPENVGRRSTEYPQRSYQEIYDSYFRATYDFSAIQFNGYRRRSGKKLEVVEDEIYKGTTVGLDRYVSEPSLIDQEYSVESSINKALHRMVQEVVNRARSIVRYGAVTNTETVQVFNREHMTELLMSAHIIKNDAYADALKSVALGQPAFYLELVRHQSNRNPKLKQAAPLELMLDAMNAGFHPDHQSVIQGFYRLLSDGLIEVDAEWLEKASIEVINNGLAHRYGIASSAKTIAEALRYVRVDTAKDLARGWEGLFGFVGMHAKSYAEFKSRFLSNLSILRYADPKVQQIIFQNLIASYAEKSVSEYSLNRKIMNDLRRDPSLKQIIDFGRGQRVNPKIASDILKLAACEQTWSVQD